MPQSVTKFSPSNLLQGNVPDNPVLLNNNYYLPVVETCKLVKKAQYKIITKIKSDKMLNFSLPVKFKVEDDVMDEEFHYPNSRKLTPPYSGPYKILNQLS